MYMCHRVVICILYIYSYITIKQFKLYLYLSIELDSLNMHA